jgi:hypothetical protein
MLGLGIGVAGTLAALHFARAARALGGGPWTLAAMAIAAVDAAALLLVALGIV